MFAALMRVPRYAKTRSEAETKARKTGLRSRHDQRGEQGMLETSGMLALAGWPVSSQLANPASTGGHLRTAPAGRAPLLCPTTRGSLMGDRNMPARQASATCFSGMTVVWPGEKVTGSPIDR